MIRVIALKELRALFGAPSTWFILAALQFILAWSFLWRLNELLLTQTQTALAPSAAGATESVVPTLFTIAGMMVMVLAPVFTMRLLAEERRNGTLLLLASAPISSRQIVLGKFAGVVAFLWLAALSCTAMSLTLIAGTPMDIGLLAANAGGLLLLTACYAALGLYWSALAAQPIVAAVGAAMTLFGLWLADMSAGDSGRIWHAVTPTGHFQAFNGGMLQSADVVYFLLVCAVCLVLTVRRLDNSRFYG